MSKTVQKITSLLLVYTVLVGLMLPIKASAAEGEELVEAKQVTMNMESVVSGEPYSLTLPYSDAWFGVDSKTYNNQLCAVSGALAAGAYGYTEEKKPGAAITESMKTLGFDEKDIETHYDVNYEDDKKGGINQIAYAFAVKKIMLDGEEVSLVVAALRGTNSSKEWLSNANINDAKLGEPWVPVHEGFNTAKKSVLEDLNKFVSEKKIDKEKSKILITGHSRGAAVGNLLGAELDNKADRTPKENFARNNIFTYTFATPNTLADEGVNIANYRNIFNIVNPEDLVTGVPFTEKTWGYKKYGITKALPSVSTNYKNYEKMYDIMNVNFEKMTGKNYKHFYHGTGLYDAAQTVFPHLIWGVYGYYSLPLKPYKRIRNCFMNKNSPNNEKEGVYAAFTAFPGASTVLQWIGADKYYKEAFVDMHTMETYLAWIQSAEQQEIFENNTYRMVEVSCDTNIEVKDENGALLCEIKDGKISEDLPGEFIPAYIVNYDLRLEGEDGEDEDGIEVVVNDEKSQKFILQIPADVSCTAFFTHKGDDDLDVVVIEKNELAEEMGAVHFNDIDLAKDDVHQMVFNAGEGLQGLTIEGNEHTHDEAESISTEDLNSVKIDVQVDGEGSVEKKGVLDKIAAFFKGAEENGAGQVLGAIDVNVGDNITLISVPNEGSELEGWYEDDTLVSKDPNYSFQVEKARKLVVKFSSVK